MSDMSVNLDAFGRPIVAVTGFGLVSSLGRGLDDNWAGLREGRSGIHSITRFSTEGLRTTIAGTVDFMGVSPWNGSDLSYALAESAGSEALAMAGFSQSGFGGPLFLAAPPIELEWEARLGLDRLDGDAPEEAGYPRLLELARQHRSQRTYDTTLFGGISERLSERLGTTGLPVTLSTACASGATAIQLGVEAIRRGETERCIAIGTDGSVGAEALIRFSLLSALSTQNERPEKASKPFSKDRDGFVMGEGAGVLVLEEYEHAKARGAKIYAEVASWGISNDAYHITAGEPEGKGSIRAMRSALESAGLTPADIRHINAHATSTPVGDVPESVAINALLGDHTQDAVVSATKSMMGHLLGGAGAVEAVLTVLAVRNRMVPPTINISEVDPQIHLDIARDTPRELPSGDIAALTNSFGFGGHNAVVAVKSV